MALCIFSTIHRGTENGFNSSILTSAQSLNTHTAVTTVTTEPRLGSWLPWRRKSSVRLTCTRRCETDPGCPPQSAGRPENTHDAAVRSSAVGEFSISMFVAASPSSLPWPSCGVALPATACPWRPLHTEANAHTAVKEEARTGQRSKVVWFTLNRSACLM